VRGVAQSFWRLAEISSRRFLLFSLDSVHSSKSGTDHGFWTYAWVAQNLWWLAEINGGFSAFNRMLDALD
jgi:hypothetical protein